jgi:hypothetical protein
MQSSKVGLATLPALEGIEILVAGGGLAGCAAAIAAGRAGFKTLLVERENCLGGEASWGLVGGSENQFFNDQGEKGLSGVPAEIIERIYLNQFQRKLNWRNHGSTYWFCHEPEIAKLTLLEMCEEAGVELLLNATITDVLKKDTGIEGVTVHTLGGFFQIRCSIAVDSTGDGSVAALADVPFALMSCSSTLLFRMVNVDLLQTYRHLIEQSEELWRGSGFEVEREIQSFKENWRNGYFYLIDRAGSTFRGAVAQAVVSGDFDNKKFGFGSLDRLGMEGIRRTKSVQINTGMRRIKGFDPIELSRAEIDGRKVVFFVANFLRKYIPGFGRAVVASTATRLGRRFSRSVETMRPYMKEDLDRYFSDSVGRYFTSPHRPEEARKTRYISYFGLIPKNVDGLIMASGKSIYSTIPRRQPHRSIGSTMLIGEIAGTAAALALKSDLRLRELDPALIRLSMAHSLTNTGNSI